MSKRPTRKQSNTLDSYLEPSPSKRPRVGEAEEASTSATAPGGTLTENTPAAGAAEAVGSTPAAGAAEAAAGAAEAAAGAAEATPGTAEAAAGAAEATAGAAEATAGASEATVEAAEAAAGTPESGVLVQAAPESRQPLKDVPDICEPNRASASQGVQVIDRIVIELQPRRRVIERVVLPQRPMTAPAAFGRPAPAVAPARAPLKRSPRTQLPSRDSPRPGPSTRPDSGEELLEGQIPHTLLHHLEAVDVTDSSSQTSTNPDPGTGPSDDGIDTDDDIPDPTATGYCTIG